MVIIIIVFIKGGYFVKINKYSKLMLKKNKIWLVFLNLYMIWFRIKYNVLIDYVDGKNV